MQKVVTVGDLDPFGECLSNKKLNHGWRASQHAWAWYKFKSSQSFEKVVKRPCMSLRKPTVAQLLVALHSSSHCCSCKCDNVPKTTVPIVTTGIPSWEKILSKKMEIFFGSCLRVNDAPGGTRACQTFPHRAKRFLQAEAGLLFHR